MSELQHDYQPVYNLKQVGVLLGIKPFTLWKYIARGDLKAKKIGRSWIVTRDNLTAFGATEE